MPADTAQDLKTGYLIGATPWKQQLALMIGVVVSIFFIGLTLKRDETRDWRTFQRLAKPIPFVIAPTGGVVNGVQTKENFTRDHIQLSSPRSYRCKRRSRQREALYPAQRHWLNHP